MTNPWQCFLYAAKPNDAEFEVLTRPLPPSSCTHLNFFDAGRYVTLTKTPMRRAEVNAVRFLIAT
jgi:hypothetical protein